MTTALLPESVYATLLDAIIDGRLRAGTALSQNKLAAHLGVSRTPVREALLRLERDGLVQRIPEMGFAVTSITAAEVEEACDLLILLDTYVYQRAARRLDAEAVAELVTLASELVSHAETGDIERWRASDQRYHAIVMAAADNRYVEDVLQQLRRRVQRFWLQDEQFDGRLVPCSQDHVGLARAMSDADEAELTAAVHAHIERLRHNVLERLRSAAPLLPRADALGALTA